MELTPSEVFFLVETLSLLAHEDKYESTWLDILDNVKKNGGERKGKENEKFVLDMLAKIDDYFDQPTGPITIKFPDFNKEYPE